MKNERMVCLDAIKLIACCLVVGLHTIRPDFGILCHTVFSVGVIAIPLFFLVNGYLMFQKEKVTYKYSYKKIIRILCICFLWELLYSVAYFLYYHEVRNFIQSFLLDFIQQGLFYHFWFFGAMILLYLLLPILHRLYKQSYDIFVKIFVSIFCICVVLSLAMCIVQKSFVLRVPQSLRVWYWLFYYMLGAFLEKNKERFSTYSSKLSTGRKIAILTCVIFMLTATQYFMKSYMSNEYAIEALYGNFFVMISVVIVFLIATNIQFGYEQIITNMSELSVGIYIFHPFILAIYKKIFPVFISGNEIMNLVFWCIVLLSSGIIVLLVRKMPIIKGLIKV